MANNIGFTGYIDQDTQRARAFAGMVADLSEFDGASRIFGESTEEGPFGVGLVAGASEGLSVLPVDANSRFEGILVYVPHLIRGPNGGVQPKAQVTICQVGRIWVPVENAVTRGQIPYMRHTPNGAGKLQKGAFRSNYDGAARVVTITPTAADSTQYGLVVNVGSQDFYFSVVSDASATATEICDAFRAQMAANATFSALVTASGTTTLILTGTTAGQDFTVNSAGAGTLGIVSTTPAAATTVKMKGLMFETSTSGAGIAMLKVNVAAYRSHLS